MAGYWIKWAGKRPAGGVDTISGMRDHSGSDDSSIDGDCDVHGVSESGLYLCGNPDLRDGSLYILYYYRGDHQCGSISKIWQPYIIGGQGCQFDFRAGIHAFVGDGDVISVWTAPRRVSQDDAVHILSLIHI